MLKNMFSTVPNNSYHFWADSLHKWLFLGMADIHEYWSKMPCLPIILTNFSRGKSHNFFHNGKIKIHPVIQHLSKHVPFIYCKLANFNFKFKMNNWIAIHTIFASSSYSKISMRLDEVDCFSGRNSGRKSSQLRLLFLWQRLPGLDLTCILLFQLSESARLLYVSLTVYLPLHSLIYIPLTYSADAAHAEQREQNDDYEVVSCAP